MCVTAVTTLCRRDRHFGEAVEIEDEWWYAVGIWHTGYGCTMHTYYVLRKYNCY
jgi:hypothetical protein